MSLVLGCRAPDRQGRDGEFVQDLSPEYKALVLAAQGATQGAILATPPDRGRCRATLVCVGMSQQGRIGRSGLSSWSNRAIMREIRSARFRVRQTMAQHDSSSLTSVLVILHYGGRVLSAAIAATFSSYPKIETER
jgi:hypothetical protein